MKKKVTKIILSCLGLVFAIIAIAMFAAPFMSELGEDVTGFDIMTTETTTTYFGTIVTGGVVAAFVFTLNIALVTLIVAIVALARKKPLRNKGAGVAFAIVGGIFSITTLALDIMTPDIVYADIAVMGFSTPDVGAGAIVSGLMLLIAYALTTASLFVGDPKYVAVAAPVYQQPYQQPYGAPQQPYGAPAQPYAQPAPAPAPAPASSNQKMAQLKELKDLLDAGLITQEEFDAKKKELLGL